MRRALGAEKAGPRRHARPRRDRRPGGLRGGGGQAPAVPRRRRQGLRGDRRVRRRHRHRGRRGRGDRPRRSVGARRRARSAPRSPRVVGEHEQVPPMYSAVRVGGRRLHEAARAGETVDRAPRRVRVHALELLALAPGRGRAARRARRGALREGHLRPDARGRPGPGSRRPRPPGRPAAHRGERVRPRRGHPARRGGAARPGRPGPPRCARGSSRSRARSATCRPSRWTSGPRGTWCTAARWLVRPGPAGRGPGALAGRRLVAVCGPDEGRLRPQRVFLGPSDLRPGAGQNR